MLGPVVGTRERVAWATIVGLLATVSAWLFAASLVLGYNIVVTQAPDLAIVIRAGVRALLAVLRAGLPGAIVVAMGALLVVGFVLESRPSRTSSLEVRRG